MKFKKLVSAISALALSASAFAGLMVSADAADTNTITLTATDSVKMDASDESVTSGTSGELSSFNNEFRTWSDGSLKYYDNTNKSPSSWSLFKFVLSDYKDTSILSATVSFTVSSTGDGKDAYSGCYIWGATSNWDSSTMTFEDGKSVTASSLDNGDQESFTTGTSFPKTITKDVTNYVRTTITSDTEIGFALANKSTRVYNVYSHADPTYAPKLTIEYTDSTVYNITSFSSAEGTAIASASVAQPGDVINVTALPTEGYKLNGYEVNTASGTPVFVENNSFTMPEEDVTISADFSELTLGSGSKSDPFVNITFDNYADGAKVWGMTDDRSNVSDVFSEDYWIKYYVGSGNRMAGEIAIEDGSMVVTTTDFSDTDNTREPAIKIMKVPEFADYSKLTYSFKITNTDSNNTIRINDGTRKSAGDLAILPLTNHTSGEWEDVLITFDSTTKSYSGTVGSESVSGTWTANATSAPTIRFTRPDTDSTTDIYFDDLKIYATPTVSAMNTEVTVSELATAVTADPVEEGAEELKLPAGTEVYTMWIKTENCESKPTITLTKDGEAVDGAANIAITTYDPAQVDGEGYFCVQILKDGLDAGEYTATFASDGASCDVTFTV